MDQLTQDLQRTLEFIKSHRWTRGGFARARRKVVGPHHPDADRWCMLGAAMRVANIGLNGPGARRLNDIDTVVIAETGYDASHYNDFVAKDKRYVIRLLTRIIKHRTRR